MPKFRRFLHGCFGYAAFLYFLASVLTIKGFFKGLLAYPLNRIVHPTLSLNLLAIGVASLSLLVRATPIILTVANGMAWWTSKAGKRSARRWAIAASASILFTSILLMFAAVYAQQHGFGARGRAHGNPNAFFLLVDVHLFVGLAGLVEFLRRDPQAKIATGASSAPVSGDGTSKALDALALVVQLGGVATGMSLYMSWSRSHHLPIVRGYLSLLQIAIILIAVTVIHESAHAFTGSLLGMKLRAFVIGPLQWRNSEGGWNFKFRPGQFLAVSGAAGLVPTDPEQSRWIEIATIAAGPLSNLLSGSVAVAFALSAQGRPYEQLWEFFALFATISFVIFAVNLIPFRPDSLYSDGARIYQILRGGPLADYHRILAIVSSTFVTPLRPRDFDIKAIQRASAHFTSGPKALRLRLLAAEYFFDRNCYLESSTALAEAENTSPESGTDFPAETYAAVVVSFIQPRPDVDAARRWWNRIESKAPSRLNAGYWLAKCAFHSAENDAPAAREAWTTAHAILQKLPSVGIHEFDRDCCGALKKLLDTPPSASPDNACRQPAEQLRQLELLPTTGTE